MAKCNALHTIINSNRLLSILKASLNIECHFLSILIHIYTHTHTIHFATQSLSYIIHLFFISSFLFKTFLLTTLYKKNKNKNKNLFFCLLVHTYSYTSSNLFLPSLLFYFPHYSLIHRYTSFIIFHNLTLLLPILFVHAYSYTSSNLSLPSHYSLLHHYTSFIIFSFL